MSGTFTIPIDGIEINFRNFTSGQLILLGKIIKDAKKNAARDGEDVATIEMTVKMLDIIENNAVSDDDVDNLLSLMASGKLNIAEIMLIMRQGRTDADVPADDDDVKSRANKQRTKKN